ncbi:MAG: hypothetical protein GY755_05980 [Chloroflexi bacterium]|nr:hypothetical protein [Chloroflexota bacterium]
MYKNTFLTLKENQKARSQRKETFNTKRISLLQQSAIFGIIIGELAGAIIGISIGFLATNLTSILLGFTAGIVFGAFTGLLIGIVVSKTAGTSGGTSVGAYSGMSVGAILGMIAGLLIPDSVRASVYALQKPMLSALALSRFETIFFISFLLSVLGTFVGVWVAGKNYEPKELTN